MPIYIIERICTFLCLSLWFGNFLLFRPLFLCRMLCLIYLRSDTSPRFRWYKPSFSPPTSSALPGDERLRLFFCEPVFVVGTRCEPLGGSVPFCFAASELVLLSPLSADPLVADTMNISWATCLRNGTYKRQFPAPHPSFVSSCERGVQTSRMCQAKYQVGLEREARLLPSQHL